jgi:hypothetical protein
MSGPEPWQRDLEDVLRRELRMVAESVEPGADGLDRIRSRISRHRLSTPGWIMTATEGPVAAGRYSAQHRLPVGRAAQALFSSAVHRFGPSDRGAALLRWMRPMAAVATGVFIVLAGSWAVTGLPQIIASSSNSSPPGAGRVMVGTSSGSTATRTGSQRPVATPRHSDPAAFPRGRHGSSGGNVSPPAASPGPPGTGLPSASPAPSGSSAPTTSPSATNSPSASPTASESCSPSPSPSPAASGQRARKPHCHKPRHRTPHAPSSQATIGNRNVRP